jgi:hypothetical protein
MCCSTVTQSKGSVIRVKGSLRSSPELRIVAGVIALAVVGTVTVAILGGGDDGRAFADTTQDRVRIQDVQPNVVIPKAQANASTFTFTVDCGKNENKKFSPDNPIAQPGVKNGAEHVHDFVGNLSTSADSTDESLDASGTTCKNPDDKSAYFWPVVRFNTAATSAKVSAEAAGTPTISCPTVKDKLPAVPASASNEVNRQLALLDKQIADASRRLSTAKGQSGPNFVNSAILGPLTSKRTAAIDRIAIAIGRTAPKPTNLDGLAECELSFDGAHAHTSTGPSSSGSRASAVGNTATPTVNCPTVRDKLPGIPAPALVEVNQQLALLDKQIADANQRLVTTQGVRDPNFIDNAILGPLRGKRVAAIDRMAIAISRVAARPNGLDALAPCSLSNGRAPAGTAPAATAPGATAPAATAPATAAPAPKELQAPQGPNSELPNNEGVIQQPISVKIEYRGNPTSKVVPMPKFLKALTGDAKATSRGPANARASWTCTGFADRITEKYPICPPGSDVQRINDFPSCWDGQNTDSANHRTHILFPDKATGACPAGTQAVPQVRITLTYRIPQEIQTKGQFFLDSFPEENHNPFSDHNDFINVNSEPLMAQIANCINTGRRCR